LTITLDSVNTDLQNTKASVPTLEEQLFSLVVDSWPNSSGTPITQIPWSIRTTLLVAPIPLKILSVAASFEYWTLAASDTAYWTGVVEHGTQSAGFTAVATRSTQNTGANANGGVAQRTAWTWDAAVWQDITYNAGDLMSVSWTPTGSPAPMVLPVTYTVRYRPA
jgi:hypothetical protein